MWKLKYYELSSNSNNSFAGDFGGQSFNTVQFYILIFLKKSGNEIRIGNFKDVKKFVGD